MAKTARMPRMQSLMAGYKAPKPKIMPTKAPPLQPGHPRVGAKKSSNMANAFASRKAK